MAGETDCVLDVAVDVVQGAEHDVALVELQEIVDDCPEVIDVGLADTDTDAPGVTVTVAEPVTVPPPAALVAVQVLV